MRFALAVFASHVSATRYSLYAETRISERAIEVIGRAAVEMATSQETAMLLLKMKGYHQDGSLVELDEYLTFMGRLLSVEESKPEGHVPNVIEDYYSALIAALAPPSPSDGPLVLPTMRTTLMFDMVTAARTFLTELQYVRNSPTHFDMMVSLILVDGEPLRRLGYFTLVDSSSLEAIEEVYLRATRVAAIPDSLPDLSATLHYIFHGVGLPPCTVTMLLRRLWQARRAPVSLYEHVHPRTLFIFFDSFRQLPYRQRFGDTEMIISQLSEVLGWLNEIHPQLRAAGLREGRLNVRTPPMNVSQRSERVSGNPGFRLDKVRTRVDSRKPFMLILRENPVQGFVEVEAFSLQAVQEQALCDLADLFRAGRDPQVLALLEKLLAASDLLVNVLDSLNEPSRKLLSEWLLVASSTNSQMAQELSISVSIGLSDLVIPRIKKFAKLYFKLAARLVYIIPGIFSESSEFAEVGNLDDYPITDPAFFEFASALKTFRSSLPEKPLAEFVFPGLADLAILTLAGDDDSAIKIVQGFVWRDFDSDWMHIADEIASFTLYGDFYPQVKRLFPELMTNSYAYYNALVKGEVNATVSSIAAVLERPQLPVMLSEVMAPERCEKLLEMARYIVKRIVSKFGIDPSERILSVKEAKAIGAGVSGRLAENPSFWFYLMFNQARVADLREYLPLPTDYLQRLCIDFIAYQTGYGCAAQPAKVTEMTAVAEYYRFVTENHKYVKPSAFTRAVPLSPSSVSPPSVLSPPLSASPPVIEAALSQVD